MESILAGAASCAGAVQQLQRMRREAMFVTDLIDQYLVDLQQLQQLVRPRFAEPCGAAMRILDPVVWDEAAQRAARLLGGGSGVTTLLQVARGHDRAYLDRFCSGCTRSVYPRTLSLLLQAAPPELATRAAVLHVTASFAKRLQRNEARRAITGQHVPEAVMHDVFERDVFEPELDPGQGPLRTGWVRAGRWTLKVVQVDNDRDLPAEERKQLVAAAAALLTG